MALRGGAGQLRGQRWGGGDSGCLVLIWDSAPRSDGLLFHPFSLHWGPVTGCVRCDNVYNLYIISVYAVSAYAKELPGEIGSS